MEIEREVRRYFGSVAVEKIIPQMARAPIERLAAVWNRIPYVESFDELFDERWSLPPRNLGDAVLRSEFLES